MSLPAPPQTHRLFPDLAAGGSLEPDDFVIGRLLEDGDRADLHWLTSAAGRERLREWLVERGERQLSRRSRAFWALVLDIALPRRDDPLWPL